jgi:hypothetical protein
MSGNKSTPLKKTIEEMQEELMARQREINASTKHVSPFARGAEMAYNRSLRASPRYHLVTVSDLERIRRQQEAQPAELGALPLTASGMMSATVASSRAYDNYIAYYRNLEQHYGAIRGNERSYLDAMEEQQRREEQRREQRRREEEHQEQRQQHQSQRARSRSRSRSRSPDNKEEAFAILGIHPTSSKEEIKKAYRRQALLLHPDKHPNNKEEATERFQRLQAAMDEINKLPGQRGGKKRYRLHRKLKTNNHRRYSRRYRKRLHKSCKSSKSFKRYSTKYRM